MTSTKCKACGAPIFFAQTEMTGQLMPVDVGPNPDGNLVLVGEQQDLFGAPSVPVVRFDKSPLVKKRLYISHFATCPRAEQFRRAK